MSNISVSKDGISISFRRFLSDTATGYTVYFVIYLAYMFELKLFGQDLSKFNIVTMEGGVEYFFFFVLAMLATPIGVVVNNSSWILYQPLHNKFERHLFNCKFSYFQMYLKKTNLHDECIDFFGINDFDTWFKRLRQIVSVFNAWRPHIGVSVDQYGGIAIYFRNLSFISLISSIVFTPISSSSHSHLFAFIILLFTVAICHTTRESTHISLIVVCALSTLSIIMLLALPNLFGIDNFKPVIFYSINLLLICSLWSLSNIIFFRQHLLTYAYAHSLTLNWKIDDSSDDEFKKYLIHLARVCSESGKATK